MTDRRVNRGRHSAHLRDPLPPTPPIYARTFQPIFSSLFTRGRTADRILVPSNHPSIPLLLQPPHSATVEAFDFTTDARNFRKFRSD